MNLHASLVLAASMAIACSGAPIGVSTQSQEVGPIAKLGSVPRAVPVENVAARDVRPLRTQQANFLIHALDTEVAALDLETELAKADPEQDKTRAPRILADRSAIANLAQLAAADAGFEAPPIRQLEAIDRFVLDLVRDRLRTESYTLGLVSPWVEVNTKFLATRNLADRDIAVQARTVAFQDLARGLPLRQATFAITGGDLAPEDRAQLYGKLRAAYADAPIPAVDLKALPTLPLAGLSGLTAASAGASATSGMSSTLPRLDGAASPLGEIAPAATEQPATAPGVNKIFVPPGTITNAKGPSTGMKGLSPSAPKQPPKPKR